MPMQVHAYNSTDSYQSSAVNAGRQQNASNHPPSSSGIDPTPRSHGRSSEQSQSAKSVNGSEKSQNQPNAGKKSEQNPEVQAEVQQLKSRDREVRTHEQAHLAAAGGHAKGGASFEYKTGPDGKAYATGGEVSIDVSPEKTPEATLAKARQVKSAALAPADPSPQDRQVAIAADQMAQSAQQEIQKKSTQSSSNGSTSATYQRNSHYSTPTSTSSFNIYA